MISFVCRFSTKAGIKKWGTDEDKFIEVFTQRSLPHLKAMLPEYQKVNSISENDTIEQVLSIFG